MGSPREEAAASGTGDLGAALAPPARGLAILDQGQAGAFCCSLCTGRLRSVYFLPLAILVKIELAFTYHHLFGNFSALNPYTSH